MHVLMLGWEFPPFITGGLGTACFGLTKAMDRRGMRVTFVVPKSVAGHTAKYVQLLSPQSPAELQPPANFPSADSLTSLPGPGPTGVGSGGGPAAHATLTEHRDAEAPARPGDASGDGADSRGGAFRGAFQNVQFIDIPSEFSNPYEASVEREAQGEDLGADQSEGQQRDGGSGSDLAQGSTRSQVRRTGHIPGSEQATAATEHGQPLQSPRESADGDAGSSPAQPSTPGTSAGGDYDGDIVSQVERYAHFVLNATSHLSFDLIHAHDWMTYPAGMMLARQTGKPLVVHIHSTEFDRSGEHVNQRIYDIERRGMNSAMRVIAVSQLTKNMVVSRYAVPSERVEVVYNGVDLEPAAVGMTGIRSKDKIVLYFGRITHQKGPEYFIRAAKRVLEVMDDVKFVVAGSGDMAKQMIEMAAELGIGHKVLFTGFLRGADIKRVFNLADLYVMPSVSEPFGIAPLEAMSHNVPVLISKSSGVSEVLSHALKVDFWDIDDMANKIVAVLRYPPLHQTLQEHGSFEVRRLTWDGAAHRCEQVYRAVLSEMIAQPTG